MKIIVKTSSSVRIDKYLGVNTNYTREFIKKLIGLNLVLVNSVKVKASFKVKDGDIVEIKEEDIPTKEEFKPVKMDLDIIYEDEYLIVINKPSGLVVHPGSGNINNTLVNALTYYTKNLSTIGGDFRPGIVHRIDKDTSGLLLVAKTNQVHLLLADDFKNKRIKREYIALLNGVFPNDSALIDAPIGRDKNNRETMSVSSYNSKNAITHMKVLKRYQNNTLVSCILDTGRTHQIRVHMKYIGYPVHNDPVYSTDNCTSFGQFLHSYKMNFIHPITKEKKEFIAPLPKEFTSLLDKLDKEL